MFVSVLLCAICTFAFVDAERKLVYAQLLFRHGARAPNKLPYKTILTRRTPGREDGAKSPAFCSEGQEAGLATSALAYRQYDLRCQKATDACLRHLGIEQQHELGTFFRNRYASSLLLNEDSYKEVFVRSDAVDRCLSATNAFLEGLFPADPQKLKPSGSDWPPIPIHSVKRGDVDMVCNPVKMRCPARAEEIASDELSNATYFNAKSADMFKIIGKATGIKHFGYGNANRIYDISRELLHNMNEKQPEFINRTWPQYGNLSTIEVFRSLRQRRYNTLFDSIIKSKPVAGFLFNDFVQNAEKAANGSNRYKLVIYSSHDSVLSALMSVMGVSDGLLPPYASCLIMEVHEDQGRRTVEFRYRNTTDQEPMLLTLPRCGSVCRVDQFRKRYSDVLIVNLEEIVELCHVGNEKDNEFGSLWLWSPLSMFLIMVLYKALTRLVERIYSRNQLSKTSKSNVCLHEL